MFRILFVAMGITCIACLGMLIDSQSRQATNRTGVEITPVPHRIYAPGRVEGQTREIELRPQHAGRVEKIFVEEGQTVAAGAPLLELDANRYRHEVSLAQAELQLAQAELERLRNGSRAEERNEAQSMYEAAASELARAKTELARLERLRRDNAISQQEFDDKDSEVRTLEAKAKAARSRHELVCAEARMDEIQMQEAKIAAAKARWDLAKDLLERCTLRAAKPGQVLKLNIELGELAGPDAEQASVILADTARFRVRAFVEEIDAPRLRVGMPATVVADGLPGQSFKGTVTRLSHRMSPKEVWTDDPTERLDTKTREIWVDLEEGSDLVVGLRVDVMIDTSPQETPQIARAAE